MIIENKKLTEEVEYKEDVIIGLVDDISLAEKRQRLVQIMKYNFKNPKDMANRYNILYSEFERKYHVDLSRRMKSNDIKDIKPKIKNKMDYIDRIMNKIPELYEMACKIYENDVEQLKKEWFDTVSR